MHAHSPRPAFVGLRPDTLVPLPWCRLTHPTPTPRRRPQVLELFQSLGLHSTRSNRNLSTSDLNGMGRGRVLTASGRGIRRNPLATSLDGSAMRAAIAPAALHRAAPCGSMLGGSGLPSSTVNAAGLGLPSRALPEPPRLATIASSPPPAERVSLGSEQSEPASTLGVRLG